jgi:2-dehydropantoate 2-reductase
LANIAIIGAGALGSLFGGRLARSGAKVTLIGREAAVAAIGRDGLILETAAGRDVIPVGATSEPAAVRGAGFILVCVKSGDTDSAAAAIAPHLDAGAVLVSLQNGVGNVERIRAQTQCPVVAGLVYIGANLIAPGHVRHSGGDRIIIGVVKDCGVDDASLAEFAAMFRAAGITADISRDVEADLWSKLVLNCAYNAVCALTGKPYGEMGAVAEVRAVMQQAADEVVALAQRKGVQIPANALESLFAMTKSMPLQMSSTAQDISKGRPTEIDYLNGYVARESETLGLAAPANKTLNALIKLRERKPAS